MKTSFGPEVEKGRVREGVRASVPGDRAGCFHLRVQGQDVLVVASNGLGWEHVSVSRAVNPPHWSMMCEIKDMFWDAEEWVCQFHPPKSQYVNFVENCLHLWKPTRAEMPTPPSFLVGPRVNQTRAEMRAEIEEALRLEDEE